MNLKLPKSTKKKIVNNIKLIYLNEKLKRLIPEVRKSLDIPDNFYSHFFPQDNKIFLEKLDGVYELIGNLIGRWSEDKQGISTEIFDKIDAYASNDEQKLSSLARECKINPILWGEIVMGRIVGVPLSAMLIMSDQFAVHYLPIIGGQESGLIPIHLNELTTLDDIKAIWPLILKTQNEIGKANKYKYAKREFSQIERNQRATELRKEGLTYSQIHKQLLKEGFDSPGYDYVSKMLKGYKNVKGGN